MLDSKEIKNNTEFFKKQISYRNENENIIDNLISVYTQKNDVRVKLDSLRSKKKILAKDFNSTNSEDIKKQSKALSEKIEKLNIEYEQLTQKYQQIRLEIPNILSQNVPIGSEDEVIYETDHSFRKLDKSYMSLKEIMSGANLSGSKFLVLKDYLATLERVLIDKMMRINRDIYTEYSVPFIVNANIMKASGQLPKFHEDMFQLTNGQYLIPTAEVPLVSLLQDITSELPIRITSATPCFRAEAGGINDGLIRTHQFQKVELVHACALDNQEKEFELLVNAVHKVLKYFEVPYRVVNVASNNIGFHAYQTYDFEVWMPSKNEYVEISSCSMCDQFQARRMQMKNVATLNGSGVAIGRMIAALIENHMMPDGKFDINILKEKLVQYRN